MQGLSTITDKSLWNQSEIAPAGSVPTVGYVAGVSRKHTGFDYFWIGTDGSVQSASWYEGWEGWRRFEIAPAGSASTSGGIAAVSRVSTAIEVWWIGPNGSVQDAYWDDGAGWNRFEFAPANSASTVAGIAAVSRGENYMEVWWIGNNRTMYNKYWIRGQGWRGPEEQAPAGQVSLSSGITLISRAENYMEVWFVGANGSVNHTWWLPGQGWHPTELAPAGSIDLSGTITPVSRYIDTMEVFWVGADGSVEGASWYSGRNPEWQRYPKKIAPPGSAATQGVSASASRVSTSVQVFWIGADGSVQSSYKWYKRYYNTRYHYAEREWTRFELAPAGSASTAGSIAVTSRLPGNMELFWVGANGSMQHGFFNAGPVAVFTEAIESHGLAALGGSVTVTVNSDGSVRWQGHAHDSGADGYSFGISALLRPSSGPVIALVHNGHVGGTFTPGSRDHDWDETDPPRPLITESLSGYIDGKFEIQVEYHSDIGSTFESLINWLVKFGGGSLLSGTGVLVFVGVEVGSLITTGSFVPGARILAGVLWMAGPSNTLLAIIADGIASLGSKVNEVSQDDYDWANAEVFEGTLPPREVLQLTDTLGPGNRAFTFPGPDRITLNMGSYGLNNPRKYHAPPKADGQIFIHELVHACQIYYSVYDLPRLGAVLAVKICEADGINPYKYGHAGFDYTELNIEQQAQIVSDWFVGSSNADDITDHTGKPKDLDSPYYRYIVENLRRKKF